MNNDYRLKQSDFKNPDVGKINSLSESEKKILYAAIQKFNLGEEASIPLQIAEKLIETINTSSTNQTIDIIFSQEIRKTPVVHQEKTHTNFEADRMIWKILGNAKPVEGKEEIIIAGQILGDGLGDWAAIRNMHKVLTKKFPDRNIRVIASSAKKWEGKLDNSNIKHLDLVYYGNNTMGGVEVPLDAFPQESEILKKTQDAGVLITAGVSINSVFESIKEELKEKSIKMNEHDFYTPSSNSDELADTIIQAGLDVLDDRMGIFTSSYKHEYSWNDIKNVQLLSGLMMTDKPSESEIESYVSSHECFFGYTNDQESKGIFIGEAVLFAEKNSPNKTVDICMPGICKNNAAFVTSNNKELFIDLVGSDVGKVHVVWFEGTERREKTIELKGNAGKLKEIRIVDPGNLSNRDFKIMINISAPLVACTGDNSLAQTISYGKIPCYEFRFRSKAKGLVYKVKEVLGEDSALFQYYNSHNVAADGLVDDAKQFGRYIREEANLKPILNGVVNEKLLRQKEPDFSQKQEVLRQKYLNYSISSTEFQAQFKALLSEKGLI